MAGKQEIAGWKWNTQPAMQHLSLSHPLLLFLRFCLEHRHEQQEKRKKRGEMNYKFKSSSATYSDASSGSSLEHA
jgi:hypothetical protein